MVMLIYKEVEGVHLWYLQKTVQSGEHHKQDDRDQNHVVGISIQNTSIQFQA